MSLLEKEQQLLSLLLPEVRAQYMRLRAEMRTAGIYTRLTETYRDLKKQAEHLKAGRSTLAVSWHQLRRALHEVILVDGVPDMKIKHRDLWLKRARMAEAHGFRQIGFKPDGSNWYIGKGKSWDPYHLEYRAPYDTLAEAVAAEGSLALRELMA